MARDTHRGAGATPWEVVGWNYLFGFLVLTFKSVYAPRAPRHARPPRAPAPDFSSGCVSELCPPSHRSLTAAGEVCCCNAAADGKDEHIEQHSNQRTKGMVQPSPAMSPCSLRPARAILCLRAGSNAPLRTETADSTTPAHTTPGPATQAQAQSTHSS